MPETAAFCPGCGRRMFNKVRAHGWVGRIPENIAGAAAYLTFLPAIAFLLVDPYRRNTFVRFHSLQCLFLWVAAIVLAVVVRLAGLVLFIVPVLGPLLVTLVDVIVSLAAFLTWFVLLVKALQGEMFRLPWLGNLAEKYLDRVQTG